jgi:hypothetical protein
MKTIVVSLGNPILGDDSRWKVAEEVKKQRLLPPLGTLPKGRGLVREISP